MELQKTAQRIEYDLDEGNFVDDGLKLSQLGEVRVGHFVNQISKNDFVELSTAFDRSVKKASKAAFGVIISAPKGNIPLESTAQADLEALRIGTINPFTPGAAYSLKLSDSNAAIAPGDYLKIGTDGALTKGATTDSGCQAAEAKAANTGGFIEVVITAKAAIDVATS